MGFQIVVAGSNVYRMTTAGVATALTLPTGITVDTSLTPSMAVLNGYVAVTNAVSRSILIDSRFNVYPMQVPAPNTAPVLDVTGGTGLTPTAGGYRVKYTYVIKDPLTNAIITESGFSPASAASGNFSDKAIKATITVSPDSSVTHRKLYRTTDGGSTYFPWIEINGNTITSVTDSLSDTELQLVAAPTALGQAPGVIAGTRMRLIVEWKDRFWGVGDVDINTLRYTAALSTYTWATTQEFTIPPPGADAYGITALLRRRNELGVATRHDLWKIVGDTDIDGNTFFQREKVIDGIGCIAPASVIVIRDAAYFLAEDGVYVWDDRGVRNLSDEGKVRKWFTSTTYFNRSRFKNAFAKYNFRYNRYELHLANAGDSTENRWIELDLETGKFYGPHLTAADTPTAAGEIIDSNDLRVPVIGSTAGFLLQQNQTAFTDVTSAIACSLTTQRYSGNTPDITKMWGSDELSNRTTVIYKKQTAAGNLSIAVAAGDLSATTTRTLSIDMSTGNRTKFSPLGLGQYCQLTITESTNSQGVELYGIELPWFEIGSR